MVIRSSKNSNRFYEKDGWKRPQIKKLITNVNDFQNVFRKMESRIDNSKAMLGEYYVIFDRHVVFSKKKVMKHEFQSYTNGKGFGDNNTWK